MKHTHFFYLTLLAFLLFSFIGVPPTWKTYTNKKGKFRAAFPNKPDNTVAKAQNGRSTYKSVTRDGILTYAVLATDSEVDLSQMKEIAQQTLDKFLQDGNEVVEKRAFLVDDYYEAIETKLKLNDKNDTHAYYKIVVGQDRIYQLMVVTVNDFPREVLVKKFYDSFEIR